MDVDSSGWTEASVRLARLRETGAGVNRRGSSQEALAESEDQERISTFKFNRAI